MRRVLCWDQEVSVTLAGISIYNNLVYNNPGDGITIGWYSKALVKDISIISNTVYQNKEV